MTHEERDAWIALAAVPGIGSVTFSRLLEHFGSAAATLDAFGQLSAGRIDRELAGITATRPRAGLGRAVRRAADDRLTTQRAVEALGGWVLTPTDQAYPPALHELQEPPLVLYGRGDTAVLSRSRAVAVVGTRRPTATGRDLAARVAGRLADAGGTVVSGLAVGVDGAAHRACLEAGATTVAVIGSGLDRPGPAAHRSLARRIAEQGAVLGELAPGVRASRGTFPRRNRIISGLARATVVIEAPARSGALITARLALEQGRTLLVAPGRPLDRRVAGNLALLRETPARPLVGLDEMLVDLRLDEPASPDDGPAGLLSQREALALLGPHARSVAATLAAGPSSVDALCAATRLDAGEVSAALTLLQLRGWARVLGAMHLPAGPLLVAGHGR